MAITENKVVSLTPLVPEDYDRVVLSDYTDGNPGTIEFYRKGQLLVTLTLTYDGDDLTEVVRE